MGSLPRRPDAPRVLIVGGGPGGIAAGIWAARLGLDAQLLESGDALGGQLLGVFSPVTDYPGIQDVDGPALAARFVDHLRAVGVPVRLGWPVEELRPEERTVRGPGGEILRGDAILLATGAVRRRLGLPLEEELRGRGVSSSVSRDRDAARGRTAVVVGGGDSAHEGALSLAEVCPRVHLVRRGSARARPDFRRGAEEHHRVTIHEGRSVRRLVGGRRLEAVELDDGTALECAWLFVRVGVEPVTGFVRGHLPHDEEGYLRVDRYQRCADGVYAVGDICSPHAMSVSVAAGHAMVACKHIQQCWLRRRPGP